MAWELYSGVLAAVQGLNGSIAYAPQSGTLWIIRDVDVYWGGGASANVSCRLIGSAGQTIWEVHVNNDVPPYDSRTWQWRGRQVIPAGGSFSLNATGGNFDVTVSGYTLTAGP